MSYQVGKLVHRIKKSCDGYTRFQNRFTSLGAAPHNTQEQVEQGVQEVLVVRVVPEVRVLRQFPGVLQVPSLLGNPVTQDVPVVQR